MRYNLTVMFSNEEIKAIASKIVKLNLSAPCAFLLEAHLPMSGILHNMTIAGSPLFSSLKGYDRFSTFFAERENIEMLIAELSK